MKKIFVFFIIGITVFFIAYFIGNEVYNNMINVNKEREFYETPEVKENEELSKVSYIKETDEMITSGLYEYNGNQSYEIDLMANDMIWNQEPKLYHKVIRTIDDYNIYDTRIGLPEITEEELKNKSVVIVASENEREIYERDIYIAEVKVENNTSYIILKQKENPNFDCKNNVFIAIIDNEVLKENIIIEIK